MREIGGYLELDTYRGRMLYDEAIKLNCARNCLAFLIEKRSINKMFLPYFICDSIVNLCRRYGIGITYYHIDKNFCPQIDFEPQNQEYIYIVNYYGQLSSEYIRRLGNLYPIIVDNTQAYFEGAIAGVDTIYSCRKFFGVPDGAILKTEIESPIDIPLDESYTRLEYLLGRFERTASEFYLEYIDNNKMFSNEPIKKMSKLTENMLHGVDYEYIKRTRTENFTLLDNALRRFNELEVHCVEGAFAYPFYVNNGEVLKRKMIEKKIYIPTLWPFVINNVKKTDLEYQFANNILPLPCDQRYGADDMQYIIDNIMKERCKIFNES